MTRLNIVVWLAVGLIFATASCSKREAPSALGTPVKIGVNIWPGYGAFFIAKDKGFDKEEQVSFDIQIIQGDSERAAALVSGRIDGIGMTLDNLAVLRARGVKAKAIFKYDNSFGADGIVAKTSITKLAQLRNRTVGWAPGTPSHFFLAEALKTVGMSTADLKQVSMAADDAGAAFAAGKLDAAVTWEPWLSKAQESKQGHVLLSTRDLPVVQDVLFLREDSLLRNRRCLPGILRAFFHAVRFWTENRAAGDQIIARNLNLPVSDVETMLKGIRLMNLDDNLAFFGNSEHPGPAYAAFEEAVDTWIREGVINKRLPANDAIDSTFLQDAKPTR